MAYFIGQPPWNSIMLCLSLIPELVAGFGIILAAS
jgi:hypothetical protein